MILPLSDTDKHDILHMLNDLIGRRAFVDDEELLITEIVFDDEHYTVVVAKVDDSSKGYQENQYGEFNRMANKTFLVPLVSEVSAVLHPVIAQFCNNNEKDQLQGILFK